jgi:hypothetical protein
MIVPVMGWDASLGVARECLECAGSRTWHSVVAVTIAAGVAHGEEAALIIMAASSERVAMSKER